MFIISSNSEKQFLSTPKVFCKFRLQMSETTCSVLIKYNKIETKLFSCVPCMLLPHSYPHGTLLLASSTVQTVHCSYTTYYLFFHCLCEAKNVYSTLFS